MPPLSDERRRAIRVRAGLAKIDLESEIDRSSATAAQKTFMRQRLAHLWSAAEEMAKGERST
jgi:hypothetical protein